MKRVVLTSCFCFFMLALAAMVTTPACTPATTTEHSAESHSHDSGTGDTVEPPKFTKIGADGFTTVSDVVIHNKVCQDIGDIKDLLAASPVDWAKVQELYEKGKHSVKSDGSIRTLNGFASTPDNFIKYSPEASAYFKDNGICQLAPVSGFACTEGKWVDEFTEAYAMKGTGPFASASDKARGAAVIAGLLVNMSYWVRLEFGKAIALAKEGNTEPLAGGPHNWDEGFAFYWGPEGKYSLYALASELSSKYKLESSINKMFIQALVDGQKKMLEEKAAPTEAADAGQKQLLRLFVLASLDAAKELDAATAEEDKDAARWKGLGYWMAFGHAIAKADKEAATTFADVFFTKKIDKDAFVAIQGAVNKALSGLGMTAADFGDALK